jgi:SulP family sulfate permease
MPYSVISGFMTGIGVLLILTQLGPFLGTEAPPGGALQTILALPDLVQSVRWRELLLAGASLGLLLVVPAKIRRYLPPQLLVLVLGTAAASVLFSSVNIRTIGVIPMGLPDLVQPTFTAAQATQIALDGLILGLLGCIDSLLTAMISDSLTREHHNSNRELIGQGIGNVVSGIFGGLPGAGATMGTVVNIQTGARSPLAAVIRSLILLAVALVAAPALEAVPLAVLAAITVKVGIDILDWSFLGRAHKISLTSSVIMYGVLVLTVLVDLIVAVGVGVFVANILTIERLSNVLSSKVKTIDPSGDPVVVDEEERRLLEESAGHVVLFHLSGPMIFGVAQAINRESTAMDNETRALVVDLAEVTMLSTTVALALENAVRDARQNGSHVFLAGASDEVKKLLHSLNLSDHGIEMTENRLEALRRARALAE